MSDPAHVGRLGGDTDRQTWRSVPFGVVFDAGLALMLVVDERGSVVAANPVASRVLGLPPDGGGLDLIDLAAEDARALADTVRLRASGRELTLVHHRSGASVPMRLAVQSLGEDHVLLTGRRLRPERELAASNDDLRREAMRAQRRLERANADLRSFAAFMLHDLVEPMRTIRQGLGLLRRRSELDDRDAVLVDRIVEAAGELEEMSEAYSRLVSIGEPVVEEVDLGEVIERACSLLGASIEHADVEIVVDALPPVLGDRDQLVRVFQNLIGNSIRHRGSTDGLRVEISAVHSALDLSVVVADNGPGLPRDAAMFRPGRSGTGLALTRRILQVHGATFDIGVRPEGGTFASIGFARPVGEGVVAVTAGDAGRSTCQM